MDQIQQKIPSEQFQKAWSAAGQYIQKQAGTGLNWLRATLDQPMTEHLSFRIGNQLFFVFIEAAEFNYQLEKDSFTKVCIEANAVPCLMPMEKSLEKWRPSQSGWGLVHAQSNKPLNPLEHVSDELIEMTDWEVHDFAMQVVCTHLEKEGKNVFSKQSSPEIEPSLWFADSDGKHFVIVRSAQYPESEASPPLYIEDLKQSCSILSESGYFASVVLSNSEDPFDADGNVHPLHRGHGVSVQFSGLQTL